jgi:hypothetical protein
MIETNLLGECDQELTSITPSQQSPVIFAAATDCACNRTGNRNPAAGPNYPRSPLGMRTGYVNLPGRNLAALRLGAPYGVGG